MLKHKGQWWVAQFEHDALRAERDRLEKALDECNRAWGSLTMSIKGFRGDVKFYPSDILREISKARAAMKGEK